jgi:hypothetical protein
MVRTEADVVEVEASEDVLEPTNSTGIIDEWELYDTGPYEDEFFDW